MFEQEVTTVSGVRFSCTACACCWLHRLLAPSQTDRQIYYAQVEVFKDNFGRGTISFEKKIKILETRIIIKSTEYDTGYRRGEDGF